MPRKKKYAADDKKVLWVQYWPQDFLEGVMLLTEAEELAYRRLVDLIYTTEDKVADDEARLAVFTRAGKEWPEVRASLLNLGKIILTDDGRISQRRTQTELLASRNRMINHEKAGVASGEARRKYKADKEKEASLDHISNDDGSSLEHNSNGRATSTSKSTSTSKKEEARGAAAPNGFQTTPAAQIIASFDTALTDTYGPGLARPWATPADSTHADRFLAAGLTAGTALDLFTSHQSRQKAKGKAPIASLAYFVPIVPEYLKETRVSHDDPDEPEDAPYVPKAERDRLNRIGDIDAHLRNNYSVWLFTTFDRPPPTHEELNESAERLGMEPLAIDHPLVAHCLEKNRQSAPFHPPEGVLK